MGYNTIQSSLHYFTRIEVCLWSNPSQNLIFEKSKIFKTLIISRFHGIYWRAHKIDTLTLIQHTVPRPHCLQQPCTIWEGSHSSFNTNYEISMKQKCEVRLILTFLTQRNVPSTKSSIKQGVGVIVNSITVLPSKETNDLCTTWHSVFRSFII